MRELGKGGTWKETERTLVVCNVSASSGTIVFSGFNSRCLSCSANERACYEPCSRYSCSCTWYRNVLIEHSTRPSAFELLIRKVQDGEYSTQKVKEKEERREIATKTQREGLTRRVEEERRRGDHGLRCTRE